MNPRSPNGMAKVELRRLVSQLDRAYTPTALGLPPDHFPHKKDNHEKRQPSPERFDF